MSRYSSEIGFGAGAFRFKNKTNKIGGAIQLDVWCKQPGSVHDAGDDLWVD